MLWNVCIAIVYSNVGHRSKRWVFITAATTIIWTVSILMAILPLKSGLYGQSTLDWCWISRKKYELPGVQWYYFYIELLVCLVLVFLCLIVASVRMMHRNSAFRGSKGEKSMLGRVMFFPLAFLLSYLGGIVNVIADQFDFNAGCMSGFAFVHTITYSLQGFFFAIAYIITQRGVPGWFKECMGRCGNRPAEKSLASRPMSFAQMRFELPSSDSSIAEPLQTRPSNTMLV
jgi:hypothetical protein